MKESFLCHKCGDFKRYSATDLIRHMKSNCQWRPITGAKPAAESLEVSTASKTTPANTPLS
jgi:hypothetical protein